MSLSILANQATAASLRVSPKARASADAPAFNPLRLGATSKVWITFRALHPLASAPSVQ